MDTLDPVTDLNVVFTLIERCHNLSITAGGAFKDDCKTEPLYLAPLSVIILNPVCVSTAVAP